MRILSGSEAAGYVGGNDNLTRLLNVKWVKKQFDEIVQCRIRTLAADCHLKETQPCGRVSSVSAQFACGVTR